MRNSWMALVLALSVEGAYPIGGGLIGNTIVMTDQVEGFVAQIPDQFPKIDNVRHRSALLGSLEFMNAGYVTIFAIPFSIQYPDLTGADESTLTQYLQNQKYQVQEVSRSSCSFFLFGENDVDYVGVGKWGAHGYVLTVPKTGSQIGKTGIMRILNTTVLDQPCQN